MKRITITSFSLLLVIGLLIVIINNKKVYTDIEGIKYAILVDGVSSNSFPSGNYKVDVSCTNAYAYWNSITSKVIIKNIKGNVTCDIEFISITSSDNLNTYITSLSGTTQGNGQLVSENGLRYEGENPNNYILFNNELWRMIGVFSTQYDTNNDGITDTTTNLVKIIREVTIGGLAWNKTSNNDWPNSTLYHLLNEQYYDWETNKESVNSYCYANSTILSKCDYSVDGIQDGYRGMIANVTWYLGGGGKSGYTTYTPDNVYSYERDVNAVYSGNSSSTSGYIGLMYESDYLYGVLASDCNRTTNDSSYSNVDCAGKDWLSGRGYAWVINPYSNSGGVVWHFQRAGVASNSWAYSCYAVYPTLYLSPDVYRVSGTGSITDPYIIGMATS